MNLYYSKSWKFLKNGGFKTQIFFKIFNYVLTLIKNYVCINQLIKSFKFVIHLFHKTSSNKYQLCSGDIKMNIQFLGFYMLFKITKI